MDEKEKLLQMFIRAKSVDEMAEIAEANGLNLDRSALEELSSKIKSEENALHGAQGELEDDELDAVNGGTGLGNAMNALLDWFSNFCAARLFGKTSSSPTIAVLPATAAPKAGVYTMEQHGQFTARAITMEVKGSSKGRIVTGEYHPGKGKIEANVL